MQKASARGCCKPYWLSEAGWLASHMSHMRGGCSQMFWAPWCLCGAKCDAPSSLRTCHWPPHSTSPFHEPQPEAGHGCKCWSWDGSWWYNFFQTSSRQPKPQGLALSIMPSPSTRTGVKINAFLGRRLRHPSPPRTRHGPRCLRPLPTVSIDPKRTAMLLSSWSRILRQRDALKKDPELLFSCFLDNAYSIRRSCLR